MDAVLSACPSLPHVLPHARKREIDDKVFKYVGVAGIDKPRIVQVGVSAANLCK